MNERDTLFASGNTSPGSFRFDERVAAVFPDMIGRSVPGYGLIVPMIGQLACRYAQADTVLHDLGSSLGAATFAMRERVDKPGVRILATDNSAAMVTGLQERLARHLPGHSAAPPVTIRLGDIRDTDFRNSSVVVLNFTLQFLEPADRLGLLSRISAGLRPGGILLLSEKLRFEDASEQQRLADWHEDFKRLQGYSELEIAAKRTALEQILLPESEATHRERLKDAGFSTVQRWFQCFAFHSFLAQK